jgi:hypothetical protein
MNNTKDMIDDYLAEKSKEREAGDTEPIGFKAKG